MGTVPANNGREFPHGERAKASTSKSTLSYRRCKFDKRKPSAVYVSVQGINVRFAGVCMGALQFAGLRCEVRSTFVCSIRVL